MVLGWLFMLWDSKFIVMSKSFFRARRRPNAVGHSLAARFFEDLGVFTATARNNTTPQDKPDTFGERSERASAASEASGANEVFGVLEL